MANGNGMTVTTAKIILSVAQAVIIGLLMLVGKTVLDMKTEQAVMQTRLENVDEKLDFHIRQTIDPGGNYES